MPWFRFYTEARADRKLDALSDAEFRVWINLLCFAAEQGTERGAIRGVGHDLLAVEVARGDPHLLAATVEKLERLRIVRSDGDEIAFVNFRKRQHDHPSDAPELAADRKRRSRAGVVTATEDDDRSRPVTTGHDTDRDRDTEREREQEQRQGGAPPATPRRSVSVDPPGFVEFWAAYPRKEERKKAVAEWKRLGPGDELTAVILAAIARQRGGRKWAEGYVKHGWRWLRDESWTDEVEPAPAATSKHGAGTRSSASEVDWSDREAVLAGWKGAGSG